MSLEKGAAVSPTPSIDPTRCSLCGGSVRDDVARPASTYASRGAYRIATCTGCGSGQTMPRPDADELGAFYAKEYKYDAHLLIEGEKRWRARQILGAVRSPRGARVLDIGCMYGYLLEEARAAGASEVVGIELSTGPAKAARERGLDVFSGTIEAFSETKREPFDLIVAQHVLEHVPDPASFLARAHDLLATDGTLCVCVPNYDAKTRRLFRESWGWYQVPVHLHHFGEHGLTALLHQNRFEVTRTLRRGGDSLMVMMTLLQSIGRMPSSASAEAPGAVSRAVVKTASAALRPYYFVGDDELVIAARKTG